MNNLNTSSPEGRLLSQGFKIRVELRTCGLMNRNGWEYHTEVICDGKIGEGYPNQWAGNATFVTNASDIDHVVSGILERIADMAKKYPSTQ